MPLFNQIGMYWRLALGLRKFLREPINLEQCYEIIKQGLENREHNLLDIAKKAIYDNKNSPYLKLLKLAGCEYGDFERMVRSDGIEPTLHRLRSEGVYISAEEFKCKKEVVRGGKVFEFKESDFDNPFLIQHFEHTTGASRSSGTRVIMNLFRYYHYAAYSGVTYDAHGIWGNPVLLWIPILPSAAGLVTMFRLAKMGNTPIRWLSQVKADRVKPSLTKRLATYYIVYAGRLFKAPLPKPEYVSLDNAYKIAGYIAEVLKKGQGCTIETYSNSAIRACQAARKGQLDISGATFVVGGEPLTEAKLKEIRAAGANVINMYGGADVGLIGFGCANPVVADEVHQFMDGRAIIQHRRRAPFADVEVDAFLFTSLLPTTAKILLNVENGDYGVIETRDCGCKLGQLGLSNHIYNIRGFDKLTGEGMTFIGTDLLRVIEEVLPAKFGGASIDYQMVEEEDDRGHTRMSVLVSPEVGVIDEDELINTILSELSKGRDTQRMMAEMWSQAKTIRVKRMRPYITAAGKLLPLHIDKK
jgi:hypothetical protein